MEKTCPACGYQRSFCQCGRPKNTTGEVRKYQNYNDWSAKNDDYARTAPFERAPAERKYMEELYPMNKEKITTWLERTKIASHKCSEYAYQQHLFNTRKQWACHTSSRYCFICVLVQQIEITRQFMEVITEIPPLNDLYWHIKKDSDGNITYSIGSLELPMK